MPTPAGWPRKHDELGKKIAWCRKIFNHKIEDPDVDESVLYQEFPSLQAREAEVSRRASAAEWVSEHARRWVQELPDDIVLETAAVAVKAGDDLGTVRRRVAEARAEITAIERAPVLDPDIRAKVEAHVAGLNATLHITGIRRASVSSSRGGSPCSRWCRPRPSRSPR